jgi:transposase
MNRARVLQGVRQMRFETLLDRHERGELSQIEAAAMLGITERTFRRWQVRLSDEGPSGLLDRRLGKPSSRRASATEIARMLGLYDERYSDFTVKHFHEQMVTRHGYKLGYTVTRLSLQAADLVRPVGLTDHLDQTLHIARKSSLARLTPPIHDSLACRQGIPQTPYPDRQGPKITTSCDFVTQQD